MARRRFFRWRRRVETGPETDIPAPGSVPRHDPSEIIDRYVSARPVTAVSEPLPGRSAPEPRVPRLRMPPRAASPGDLPSDAAAAVEDVVLPPGRRRGLRAAALWMSDEPLEDPRVAWRALAITFERSGLWPVLMKVLPPNVQWVDQLASAAPSTHPAPAAVAALIASHVRTWGVELAPALQRDDPVYHAELSALLATGAAAGRLSMPTGLRPDALVHAGTVLAHTHLALAGCMRPAQLPGRMGWSGARGVLNPAELAGILASWEERYGALLIGLSPNGLTLAVTRPPADEVEAREAAAEHLAACPDLALGWPGFGAHAASLIDAPIWQLAWTGASRE